MGAITPTWLMDFESKMQVITENEYARLSTNMWWSRLMKTRPSMGRRELLTFMLSTAQIEDFGLAGGKQVFEELVSKYVEYEAKFSGTGFKIRRAQLEDVDGNGVDLAAEWSAQIGAQMAYWPQKQLALAIKAGHLTTSAYGLAYDSKAFFATDHPVNPFDTGKGTFQNILTGGASGSYPGACPIDDSVTVDVALVNLAKIQAYIRSIKMPNGVDPRFLRPSVIVAPPRMQQRIVQLTNAKFVAQAAASGGGSGDVEALIASFGFVQPIIADELAGFESDTTFFVGCEQTGTSALGAFTYVDREPFRITYYTGQGGGTGVDAILDRADELEWHCKGRNVVGYGHPYLFFKCKAS